MCQIKIAADCNFRSNGWVTQVQTTLRRSNVQKILISVASSLQLRFGKFGNIAEPENGIQRDYNKKNDKIREIRNFDGNP